MFESQQLSAVRTAGRQKKKKLRKELEKIQIWAQTHMQYTMKTEVVGCDL